MNACLSRIHVWTPCVRCQALIEQDPDERWRDRHGFGWCQCGPPLPHAPAPVAPSQRGGAS